jgi:hypothetical protein
MEGVQFASACTDIVAAKEKLTGDVMSVILKKASSCDDCARPSRDEYIAPTAMSRL